MGNSSSKDSRSRSSAAAHDQQPPLNSIIPPQSRSANIRVVPDTSGTRGSRQDIPVFLSSRRAGGDNGASSREDRPRETRQEREARRAERERQARLKERERSMREEGVDGGYLVTLGVYTGAEDFSKSIVRQLQIERRLAPFWKGLNDHSDSWAEHQLVAAVRGLPIPAPDEIPPEMARTASRTSSNRHGSDINVNNLTIPISSRSQSYESSTSANLSASHPAFSTSSISNTPSAAQLLRGRAKTLASLATGSKSHPADLTPQEIRLPQDPNINGTPVEAYLYKDATECPICFMYYPPYLNKTRCCDQPICSECFVQIKRPDPHPPEHEQPGQPRPPEEEAETLVSEVAACPFCVTPEFGVSYDPPPFRRGLAYANQPGTLTGNALRNPTSAMSSSTSLTSGGSGTAGRRRATSLSANAPQVITTDRVRPDWARKLADARAHALRRSAAATALHNAAYVLGNQGGDGGGRSGSSSAFAGFGRRNRRTTLVDATASPGSGGSGTGTPGIGDGDGAHSSDLYPERGSSARRGGRTRVEDIEELMMMEAIRLSLATEDERKRKEEKEIRKEAKKKDKEAKKEAKAADKDAKRNGSVVSLTGMSGSGDLVASTSANSSSTAHLPTSSSAAAPTGLYQAGPNDSTSSSASTGTIPGAGLGSSGLPQSQGPAEDSERGGVSVQGKGKEPVQDFAGFNPLEEPTSTLNTEMKDKISTSGDQHDDVSEAPSLSREDPQKHLEASRANLQPIIASASASPSSTAGFATVTPIPIASHSPLSAAVATATSETEEGEGTGEFAHEYGSYSASGFAYEEDEPMLNYTALARRMGVMEGGEDSIGGEKAVDGVEHIESVSSSPPLPLNPGAGKAAADNATPMSEASETPHGVQADVQTSTTASNAANRGLHADKVAGHVQVLDRGAADEEAERRLEQ